MRDLQGNIITARKKPQNNINYYSYDFGQMKPNMEKLSIEEINKMKRHEMEKAFQNENLIQMEEKNKKKEYDKKMKVIEQEIEEQKILNERKMLGERVLEESKKKE